MTRQHHDTGLKYPGTTQVGQHRDAVISVFLDRIGAYHHRPSAPTNLNVHQAIDINLPIGCGDVPVFTGARPQSQLDFAAWRSSKNR